MVHKIDKFLKYLNTYSYSLNAGITSLSILTLDDLYSTGEVILAYVISFSIASI